MESHQRENVGPDEARGVLEEARKLMGATNWDIVHLSE
jgi:hypothetical protein